MTKSHFLQIFECQYLVEILRYGYNFLHVIITFIGFKITFSNIRSQGAPLLISRGWRLAPPGFFTLRQTFGLKGLRLIKVPRTLPDATVVVVGIVAVFFCFCF